MYPLSYESVATSEDICQLSKSIEELKESFSSLQEEAKTLRRALQDCDACGKDMFVLFRSISA